MKIGVLIKKFEKLSNWELRVIDNILNHNELELSLLILDGREDYEIGKSLIGEFKRLLKSKNILGELILKIQIQIEKRLFKENKKIDKESIINKLKTIDKIYLKPKRKDSIDIFSGLDAKKIKSYNLDVILKHEFNISGGDILNSSKYGLWAIQCENSFMTCLNTVCFQNILLQKTSIDVTLLRLTKASEGGIIIDKAFFNYHWSYVKTNKLIQEASVSLILKNLKQLQIGNYAPTKSNAYYNQSYKTPRFADIIKYVFRFYFKITRKAFERLKYLLFGTRYDCWTLFLGEGDFLNTSLAELKPIKLPKNEYWADPFIFNFKEVNYVFFENYDYSSKKGKISCGRIKGNELIDIKDVLDLDYHLSYPFIFEENGDTFLMPETYANDRLEIYKCISFPNKWELYSTAFEGEKLVDASYFVDENSHKWLFINKLESELFIYKIDSLKLEYIEPHSQNPVIINSETARNGGPVFRYEGELYRPSQANIEGVYGRALNINKIERLTIDEYIEKTSLTVFPNFQKGLISMHHLHQTDELFVIDAAYRKYREN